MVNNLWCAALIPIVISLSACGGPLTYSSDPIDAAVVDADTGQPIEGAIVTANWQLVTATLDNYKMLVYFSCYILNIAFPSFFSDPPNP